MTKLNLRHRSVRSSGKTDKRSRIKPLPPEGEKQATLAAPQRPQLQVKMLQLRAHQSSYPSQLRADWGTAPQHPKHAKTSQMCKEPCDPHHLASTREPPAGTIPENYIKYTNDC